jgi:hypothetical protein
MPPLLSSYFVWSCQSLVFTVLVCALSALIALPYAVDHVIPSNSLPPAIVWRAGFSLLAWVDALLRVLTPPNLSLFRELMGYVHTVELYTAADLCLADAIARAGVPLSVEGVPISQLAVEAAPGCIEIELNDPTSPAACAAVELRVERLLRALASYGIFRESVKKSVTGGPARAWTNTAASDFLRIDHPASLRPAVLNFGAVQMAMMAQLPDAVRSGVSSFSAVHGSEMWDYYAAHPDSHAIFDATMNALGKLGAADVAIATGVEWSKWADILIDVGGGFGEMALTILQQQTSSGSLQLSAIIFDLPHVVARAEQIWMHGATGGAAAGVSSRLAARPDLRSRVSFVGGDMFDSSTYPTNPNSRTAFLLRDILHDWPDNASVRILKGVRGAMVKGDSVVIVGRVLIPGAGFIESLGSADADIVMMGAFGSTAGERSVEHYARLFTEAGLKLESATSTRSQYYIIRAVARLE